MDVQGVERAVLDALDQVGEPAAFVSELQAALPLCDAESFATALEHLRSAHAIVIVGHEAPDPHLAGADLRIAAPVRAQGPRAKLRPLRLPGSAGTHG